MIMEVTSQRSGRLIGAAVGLDCGISVSSSECLLRGGFSRDASDAIGGACDVWTTGVAVVVLGGEVLNAQSYRVICTEDPTAALGVPTSSS